MSELQQVIFSTLGGMNQAVDPQILFQDQYAMGVNLSTREGLPKTRPRFKDAGYTIPAGNKFQGAATYSLADADRIVFGIEGHVYSLNLSTGLTTDHGLLLSPTADKFYFCQAERYFIIQDGESGANWVAANWPVILTGDALYDQSALRASDPEQALPKGSAMAYGHGRLFVVTNYIYEAGAWSADLGAVGFVAGDISKAYAPEEILTFSENVYWNEGGRFVPAAEIGTIHALAFQLNVISGVGVGPLMVLGESGVSSFEINAPRAQWKDIDIAKVMFLGSGTYSTLSLINVNSDLIFRSTQTEIRTFRESTSQFGGDGLANIALSGEVKDVLARDNIEGMKLCSGAYHNKRILMTSGYQDDGTFNSIVSLDLSPIEIQITQRSWIWDGVWTGADWLGLVSARTTQDGLYAFCKASGVISLLTLDDSVIVDGAASQPVCRLYTGYKHFAAEENAIQNFTMKQFKYAEVWFSEILGDLDVTVYFRSDSHPLWAKTNAVSIRAPSSGFGQIRRHIRLTPDRSTADPAMGDALFSGYSFQFCIEWTGSAKLDKSRFVAETEETVNEMTVPEETEIATAITTSSDLLDLNNYEYRFTL